MANSITDVFAAMQNGVIALGKFQRQLTGSFNNIQSALTSIKATIPSTFVITFNARSSAVVPVQGDYPTNLIPGTSTNDNATAGNIGEYIVSAVSTAAAVAANAAQTVNITSIALTAGDWDIRGNTGVLPSGANTSYFIALSTTSATFPADNLTGTTALQLTFTSATRQILPIATTRFSLGGPGTVFLIGSITGSSALHYGTISARRVR